MSDSFLSRWSRRKLEVREQEKQLDIPKPDLPVQQTTPAVPSDDPVPPKGAASAPQPAPVELPLPTEADLKAIEQGGDIKAFMVDKVSADLKNKAFKALFSRPEFNVMDGLDIYIDDYNKFIPLTQEDIGKMALSKQLLSRPDLELPKTSDVVQNLIPPVESTVESVDSVSSVLDKTDVDSDESTPENSGENAIRVIPNESQVDDSKDVLENRTFENSGRK